MLQGVRSMYMLRVTKCNIFQIWYWQSPTCLAKVWTSMNMFQTLRWSTMLKMMRLQVNYIRL